MEGSSERLRKGVWTAEEDGLLRQCIDKYGEGKWNLIPLRAGLYRYSKSCRERWCNYLKPSLKGGRLSPDEADLVHRLHKLLGNRWSLIAGRLPGRTANDVKNYWKTQFGKMQGTCCKSKFKEREISGSSASPSQKLTIIKPQYQSCNDNSQLNGKAKADLSRVSNRDGYNKDDEENYEFLNNLMDGESMWWDSLLAESQEAYAATTTHEADNSLTNSTSSIFEVDQFWSLFNSDTREDNLI